MPTLSMFFGVIVRMYYTSKIDDRPHIHVYYGDFSATVDIETCEILEGSLPTKQTRLVLAWIEIHRGELIANWALYQNGETPFSIDPIK